MPSFYRPEFLWGLLFLGAVLLIHLLRRPPRRQLDFSTLRFFSIRAIKTARIRHLRKLLLLLSRLAAAATLVLLFAQPFDRNDPITILRNPHLTVFSWIDRTPSMDYAAEGSRSLLSHARSLVDTLQRRLPSTVRHFRYDEAEGGFVLRAPARPLPASSRHGPPRLDNVLRSWNECREGCSLPLLVLISDFHKSTSIQCDTLFRRMLQSKQPFGRVMCVSLAPRECWNYSVRSAGFNGAGKVSATLASQGKKLDSAGFSVFMSSTYSGQKKVSCSAGDTEAVEVLVPENTADAAGGHVELCAPDPLAFDNTSYFISRSRNVQRVLVIGDRERNFPLAAAISSSGKGRWGPVTVKESGGATFDDLDSADVIIVNAAGRTSRPLEALFAGQAFSGKTVLCALDDNEPGFNACAALIAKAGQPVGQQTVWPTDQIRPETLSTAASIVLPDTLSETWHGFPALRARECSIDRYGTGLPGTVILRCDNGAPLVTHVAGSRGSSFLFIATPLGITKANNLCETGFYVPFVDRIVRYAVNERRVPPDVWIAGFERRNPFFGSSVTATVLNDKGTFLERWQSQPSVLFKQPGLYEIVPDKDETFWIAVNPDPEESALDYRLPVIPDETKNNSMILNEMELINYLKGRGNFRSYLPWLVLILFLFAETLLWQNPSALPGKNQQRP
jgi:hypothetical protein